MDERIGFGIYQSCGDMGSVGHVSVFGYGGVGGVGGVGGEWVGAWTRVGSGGVVLYLCEV